MDFTKQRLLVTEEARQRQPKLLRQINRFNDSSVSESLIGRSTRVGPGVSEVQLKMIGLRTRHEAGYYLRATSTAPNKYIHTAKKNGRVP